MKRSYLLASSLIWFSCGQGNQNEPPVCGNLIIEAGEQCDDGNSADADGCEADCSLPRCQNGIVDPGEACFSESQLLLSERPIALTSGDLNADGNQDIITANAHSKEIGVFLGQGNGSLAKAQRFSLSQIPTAIAAADANADGLPDLFVTFDDTEAAANFSLLTNTSANGILSFDEQPLPSVGNFPKEILAADINVDGIIELIILSQVEPSIALRDLAGQVILNIQLDAAPTKLLLADLNIDTFPELLVSFEGANQLSIFANNAGTISAASTDLPTAGAAGALSSADADGDGAIDLVAVALSDSGAVELFLNTAGVLAPLSGQGPIPVGLTPSAVQLLDLDGDADPDLFTTNLSSNDVTILFNEGGVFGNTQRINLGQEPSALLAVDLNNDSAAEFVALNQASDELSVLSRQNNTLQETRVATLGAPTLFVPLAAGAALIAHPASSDITSLANNNLTRIATPIPADAIALADFDNDAQQDFALVSAGLGQVSVFFQATATFSAPIQVGTGPSDVVAADFTGDGFVDVVTSNALSNNLTLLVSNADIAALAFTRNDFEIQGLALPTAMAAGDMDGDADLDLVVANGINGDVFVLLQNAGVFTAAGKKKVGTSASAIGLADLSGDGKLDIVVTSPDNNDAQVVINAGFAAGLVQFKEPVVLDVGLAPSSVSFGDFDLDGQLDALITNEDSNDLVLLRNGGINGQGQAEFATEFFVLDETPFGALIFDQNQDDFSDLLVGLQSARTLRLLLAAP